MSCHHHIAAVVPSGLGISGTDTFSFGLEGIVTSSCEETEAVWGTVSAPMLCAGRVEALEGLSVDNAVTTAVGGVTTSRGDGLNVFVSNSTSFVILLYLPKNCLVFSL